MIFLLIRLAGKARKRVLTGFAAEIVVGPVGVCFFIADLLGTVSEAAQERDVIKIVGMIRASFICCLLPSYFIYTSLLLYCKSPHLRTFCLKTGSFYAPGILK